MIVSRLKPRPETVFSFRKFHLIPSRQLLLFQQEPVKLGGRALDLLLFLVQRSGELVSKQELFEAAWPDTCVHEGNLKVNMSGLRRALGDSQDRPTFIATVVGRGYRFIAPVLMSDYDMSEEESPRMPEFAPSQRAYAPIVATAPDEWRSWFRQPVPFVRVSSEIAAKPG